MANKKTVALSGKDYEKIIKAIEEGFVYADKNGKERKFRKNPQLATILKLECVLGLRISDILSLKISDIIADGERYRLDILEQKTKKKRQFTVPDNVRSFIVEYAYNNKIADNERLFTVGERAVQKQLAIVSNYVGLDNISTHSFRKRFATRIYKDSNYNLELVRQLLQHSSAATTSRYIGIGSEELEEALQRVSSDLQVN